MKLNKIETSISPYTFETMNDEMVIYNEESKKIIVLNQTAMLVWKKIMESSLENVDICTEDIASALMKIYDISESEINAICNDVDETIDLLFQSSLLKK